MAQTVNDFILEFGNYEYSEECYELMKECSELNLMATYIENQEFIINNYDEFGIHTESFNGYFQEAADQSQLEMIQQNFNEKAGNIFSNIGNGFKKILTTIRNFIVRIINKFDDSTKLIATVRKRLESASGINIDDLDEELFTLARKCGITFSIKQSAAKGLKVPAEAKKLKNFHFLVAALSLDYVYINNDSGPDACVSLDRLAKLFKRVSGDKTDIKSARDELSTAMKENRFEINVNEGKLKKIYNDLDELSKTIDTSKEDNNKVIADNSGDEDKKSVAAKASELNGFYTELNKVVANTMKMYTAFVKYRHNAANMISSVVTNKDIGDRLRNMEPNSKPVKDSGAGLSKYDRNVIKAS